MSTPPATALETVDHTGDGPDPPYLYPDYKSTLLRASAQPLVRVAASPLEATGPAFPKRFVQTRYPSRSGIMRTPPAW